MQADAFVSVLAQVMMTDVIVSFLVRINDDVPGVGCSLSGIANGERRYPVGKPNLQAHVWP